MRKSFRNSNLQSGQAMLLAVLFFLAITTTIVMGTATPILKQVKISNDTLESKLSYYLAEAALEDALYRIKNGKNIVSGDTVVVNGYTATTTITTTTSGKTIETLATIDGKVRKMQAKLIKGTGVVFKYGTQAGQGGMIFENNAFLSGTLYSNGNIIGSNGAYITGDAYSAGSTGLISNIDVGTAGTGHAYAHTVTDSTVTGTIYCQTGSGNNKSCDTSLPDPAPIDLPISNSVIDTWKSEAEDGGIVTCPADGGAYTISSGTVILGPRKIPCDLTISNTGTLTVAGTIWVTGNITFTGSATGSNVDIAATYNGQSGIMLADGRITVDNKVTFRNNGTTGSYVMLLSTDSCDELTCSGKNAIDLSNNTQIVIANAQNGTIAFSNNSQVKEAVANKIRLKQNVGISYGTGLSSVNFSSGPGGAYNVSSWKEIE